MIMVMWRLVLFNAKEGNVGFLSHGNNVVFHERGQGNDVEGENVGVDRNEQVGEQCMGPMESLSFSVGHNGSVHQKLKKNARRVKVDNGRQTKVGEGKLLGEKRKYQVELDSGMDGYDINMAEADELGKKIKVSGIFDRVSIPLTVAEVGAEQYREGQ